jgi:hypothetical protein
LRCWREIVDAGVSTTRVRSWKGSQIAQPSAFQSQKKARRHDSTQLLADEKKKKEEEEKNKMVMMKVNKHTHT